MKFAETVARLLPAFELPREGTPIQAVELVVIAYFFDPLLRMMFRSVKPGKLLLSAAMQRVVLHDFLSFISNFLSEGGFESDIARI